MHTSGMAARERLDQTAILDWAAELLESRPVKVLFSSGHLSQVVGVRLADGRDVVVKVRRWEDRLTACGQVQDAIWAAGFPAPRLLVAPTREADCAISVEALVADGELLPAQADSAALFARALAELVAVVPEASSVGTLSPSPPWVDWDHPEPHLWPAPDDREGDLNAHAGNRWLDEYAAAARDLLMKLDEPKVIGHGDWYSQNLRWNNRRLHVVYDWDSVVAQPEAAIAGLAAAIWPGTGVPGEVAMVRQTERFLEAYIDASGRRWTSDEVRAAWAAGLWTRAFDAKKVSLVGESPHAALTPEEAQQRNRRAGL